jgi:hypothetical protein
VKSFPPFLIKLELLKRLEASQCELCQSTEQIEVHHIRKLADLKKMRQKPVLATFSSSTRNMSYKEGRTLFLFSQMMKVASTGSVWFSLFITCRFTSHRVLTD